MKHLAILLLTALSTSALAAPEVVLSSSTKTDQYVVEASHPSNPKLRGSKHERITTKTKIVRNGDVCFRIDSMTLESWMASSPDKVSEPQTTFRRSATNCPA